MNTKCINSLLGTIFAIIIPGWMIIFAILKIGVQSFNRKQVVRIQIWNVFIDSFIKHLKR